MMILRRRVSLVLLNLGAALVVLGGIGDILVDRPPAAWDAVAGVSLSTLPPGVSRLSLALLDALGSALVGAGIATVIVVNGPLRRGERWASFVVMLLALVSEGGNAAAMVRLGLPYYWVPVGFVVVIVVGLAIAHVPTPVFGLRPALDDRGTAGSV